MKKCYVGYVNISTRIRMGKIQYNIVLNGGKSGFFCRTGNQIREEMCLKFEK